MTETSPLAAAARPPKYIEPGTTEAMDYRATTGRVLAGVELRIVGDDGAVLPWDGVAVGEIQVRGPVDHRELLPRSRAREVRRRLVAHRRHRERRARRLRQDHRPHEGRHQVGRRVDLVGRARGPPHGARRRRRGRGDRRARRRAGTSDRSPASSARVARASTPWSCATSSPRASRRGSSPSAGRSSTRCRRRASGSSTRRCSGRATPTASSWWRSSGDPSLVALVTPTLAASVFERLGDDLWLLVPAFFFALVAGALIGRILGVRRSVAATLSTGVLGLDHRRGGVGARSRPRPTRASRTSPATCSCSRCSARWPPRCGSSSSPGPA